MPLRRRVRRRSAEVGTLGPVPGKQVVEAPGRIVGQPREHVGEPGLRIDAIELGGLDQRVELRSAMAARVRAGGGPVAAAHRDGTNPPFGSLVLQVDAPIAEEAAEGGLALEHVVDRLRHRSLGRELGAIFSQPRLQLGNEGHRADASLRATLIGDKAADGAFDGQDRVDPRHCLDGDRSLPQIGQLEELATGSATAVALCSGMA